MRCFTCWDWRATPSCSPCSLRRCAGRTLDSWRCERRVVGNAEILGDKDNPRFIVTNLAVADHAAAPLYEEVYCGRGDMENAVKEHQLDLFGERLSCAGFASNEVRLLLGSFA